MTTQNDTFAGQAVYNDVTLSLYDFWVLKISNTYFWKCPTQAIVDQFIHYVSRNHLDIGVGTGYYLKRCLPYSTESIGLMDLNQSSLNKAASQITSLEPKMYCHDVFQPYLGEHDTYDSISMNYLLHCLPGDIANKSIIFKHCKSFLNQGGRLFGSSIIANQVTSRFGQKLSKFYNKKGIFSNENDTFESLKEALKCHFKYVEIKMQGSVALFVAYD